MKVLRFHFEEQSVGSSKNCV